MASHHFRDEELFGNEAVAAITAAFETACRAMGLLMRADPLTDVLMDRIIAAARAGEHDPGRLCKRALEGLSRDADRASPQSSGPVPPPGPCNRS